MFSLMIQKLFHKKWMVLCLLIGNILLLAVTVSHPMYRVSSFQKMLTDEFTAYEEKSGTWPAFFATKHNTIKGSKSGRFMEMQTESEKAVKELGMDVLEKVYTYQISSMDAKAAVVRDGKEEKRMKIAAASDLGQHIEIIYGRMPEEGLNPDGFLEVVVSDQAMISQDLLIDDEYTFEKMYLEDGSECKIKIVGVFAPLDETELYWQPLMSELKTQVLVSVQTFTDLFLAEGVEEELSFNGQWNFFFDYEDIETSDVEGILKTMNRLERSEIMMGRMSEGGYKEVLESYTAKSKRIEATLMILQVPVILLLCAFLYMISGQMLSMEQNEISLMKSRGATKGQILSLYIMQSVFLVVISLIVALPLGAVLCKVLGSSTAFLEFSATRTLDIQFTWDIIWYAIAAMLISVLMTTVPVISYSGISIVNLKQKKGRKKKAFWKKMYLDFICIAISMYGYYSFNRSEESITEEVLSGKALDPLLYISFSLFILGAGLLFARIQPYILQVIFKLFQKKLRPAAYASILGTIRTGGQQEFIILFMILTVSIGISNTVIARTIISNATENTKYIVGADIVVKEKWENNQGTVAREGGSLSYTEPEFSSYEVIEGVNTATKVLKDEVDIISGDDNIEATVMGIKAKGFAAVTTLEDSLLPYAYYDYLNVLATNKQAVIVSENFLTGYGYKLGDTLTLENEDGKKAVVYIYGFFPYWPTYQPVTYSVTEDGNLQKSDEYLVVGNLSYFQDRWGVTPYEVWMDVEDEGEGVYSWFVENPSRKVTKFVDMSQEEEDIVRDTLFQGTNGILSMSFLIILLLCGVGYLIYWIMSIRSRELLFGVLRAMGMRKGEITWLLVIEQICSGLFAIVVGGFIGVISSDMFVPMIQKAYAASEQVLPLRLITSMGDMIQLFAVIAAVLCICLVVLGNIVSKLNISSALKLGED